MAANGRCPRCPEPYKMCAVRLDRELAIKVLPPIWPKTPLGATASPAKLRRSPNSSTPISQASPNRGQPKLELSGIPILYTTIVSQFMSEPTSPLTHAHLTAFTAGDTACGERLLPVIYDELRGEADRMEGCKVLEQ